MLITTYSGVMDVSIAHVYAEWYRGQIYHTFYRRNTYARKTLQVKKIRSYNISHGMIEVKLGQLTQTSVELPPYLIVYANVVITFSSGEVLIIIRDNIVIINTKRWTFFSQSIEWKSPVNYPCCCVYNIYNNLSKHLRISRLQHLQINACKLQEKSCKYTVKQLILFPFWQIW